MCRMWLKHLVLISVLTWASCAASTCVARDYGQGSVVCVCNATYCDTVEGATQDQLSGGAARHYVSSKAGKRLEPMAMKFSSASARDNNAVTFKVNRQTQYQKIFGFGGAATDSAALNTYSLSSDAADKLIRSYFSEQGIGYTFIRVPLGGSDFSTHKYAYLDNDPDDVTLKNFNLSTEDFTLKMPFIKRAEELSPEPVKLFTAAWSAPNWMKNIDAATGASSLKAEYYQVYANYYVKFLDAYAAEGLKFWGLTPQNEPNHGLTDGGFNSMGWHPSQMQDYLVANLCPALRSAGYAGLKLMIMDDLRTFVSNWEPLYQNESIRECVSGMSVHFYTDTQTDPNILNEVHQKYPEKFFLYAEACAQEGDGIAVALGSWSRGQEYMTDLIQVTNHWVTGWVDWNMVLDLDGGPNWAKNTADAPVIVNATADEFYKQPMFYALAHFAKFVPPGSVRIALGSEQDSSIENVAFLTPDNVTVVILHNKAESDVSAVISDPDKGSLTLKIPATSMNTIIYK